MNRKVLIILSSFLFLACQNNTDIPGDVLPPRKMQAVLWDMVRADQFLASFVFSKDTSLNKQNESIKLYQQIFRIHEINKNEFRQSFSYYESHPELLKIIMDSLQKKSAAAFSGVTPLAADSITRRAQEVKIKYKDSLPVPVPPVRRVKKYPKIK